MAALSKRLVIRLGDDLDAWITQRATLEGLDNAAWVRSLLAKTMNGLVPLPAHSHQPSATPQTEPDPRIGIDPNPPTDDLDTLLANRVEQAAESASPSPFVTAPPAEDDLSHERVGVAHPLRRVERSRYNPGRTGYG